MDPETPYDQERVPLAGGDRLFLYTDGISEAQDPLGEIFTEARLDRSLADIGFAPVESLVGRITDNVRVFTGDAPLHDDVTCLVLRWMGNGAH